MQLKMVTVVNFLLVCIVPHFGGKEKNQFLKAGGLESGNLTGKVFHASQGT